MWLISNVYKPGKQLSKAIKSIRNLLPTQATEFAEGVSPKSWNDMFTEFFFFLALRKWQSHYYCDPEL